MELRRLRYFLRIASEGSLGKASRALGIAQPALGRQVQLLESELGVKLFERVPKGMRLTDEGEYLKDALEHPLQLVDIALKNVRSYSARVEATLVLGLSPTIADFMGPRLVRRLQQELPNLKLRVVETDSARLAADLGRSLVDIALLAGEIPDSRCFHSEVLTERLMLVVPSGDRLASRGEIGFRELQAFPLVLPGSHDSLRTKLAKLSARAEVRIEPVLEIDSAALAKQAVLAGCGYAIMTPLAFRSEAERGDLAGIPITGPVLEQTVLWAIQPRWRVPRSTYNAVERVIFGEWHAAVSSGEWPADWLMDLDRLSSAVRPTHTDPA